MPGFSRIVDCAVYSGVIIETLSATMIVTAAPIAKISQRCFFSVIQYCRRSSVRSSSS